jgi:Tfp pilus assembly protein PilO
MSEKNFLQELQSIKNKVEYLRDEYEIEGSAEIQLNEIRNDLQEMINHCIELQLMITKDEKMKQFIKDNYK